MGMGKVSSLQFSLRNEINNTSNLTCYVSIHTTSLHTPPLPHICLLLLCREYRLTFGRTWDYLVFLGFNLIYSFRSDDP